MQNLNLQLKLLETSSIDFGDELGKGGEGSVFTLKNAPDLAIKIYHNNLSKEKAEKILAMVRLKNERLLNLSAWPLASYHAKNGVISGFIMPRLKNHLPLYELYNPRIRLQKFPQADWRFLIHVAANIARAFEVIHGSGHVIGDVNHGNLVVAPNATVRFIDTDSFQIIEKTKSWLCEVGVATHQPPEMQGISFKDVIRTPNHDNFGLAVLIFQMLFLGRHPYSGVFQGQGELSLEKAIAEYRFAFSSNSKKTQMLPPPACLAMDALTPHMRILFERAFSENGAGTQVGLRPTPDEWVTALTVLASNVIPCTLNAGHYYIKDLRDCPWCEIDNQIGQNLFPSVAIKNTSQSPCIDITSICKLALSISDPGNEPSPPTLIANPISPSTKAKEIKNMLRPIKTILIIIWILFMLTTAAHPGSKLSEIGVCGTLFFPFLGAGFYFYRKKKLVKEITKSMKLIKSRWDDLISKWNFPLPTSSFNVLRSNISKLKQTYDELEASRQSRINESKNKLYNESLRNYLRQFDIENATIEGIGPKRLSMLKNSGIQTACDVYNVRVVGINGFSNTFQSRLLLWRDNLEAQFKYVPNQQKLNQHISLIDKEISDKQKQIAQEIAKASQKLTCYVKNIQIRRQQLSFEADLLITEYSLVKADIKYLRIITDIV